MRRFLGPVSLLGAFACTPPDALSGGQDHPLPEGEFGEVIDHTVGPVAFRQVDVLFVVENSRGMGREQGALAASMESLVRELTLPHLGGDFRVAVTTTDLGNTWWCNGTTPEAGAFVYSSCLDREPSFTSQDGGDDDFARACTAHCSLDNAALGIGPGSQPWLEANTRGETNLPEGVSVAEALACLVPQGVDGCGFEAPLEAMRRGLLRASSEGEPEFGFFREGSKRVVVFLSEEFDCSVDSDHQGIFDPDGAKAFWSDPQADVPTSALCWNAGVLCEGEAGALDCVTQHYDELGEETTWGYAVMTPVYDFVDTFDNIASQGYVNRHNAILIGGVGQDGVPAYSSLSDVETLNDFGIDPGCETEPYLPGDPCTVDDDCPQLDARCNEQGNCEIAERAFPPVRLAEFVREVTGEEGSMHSICQDEYGAAMAEVASGLETFADFEWCLYAPEHYDSDPVAPGLQPECVVTKVFGAGDAGPTDVGDWSSPMHECTRAPDGSYELNEFDRFVVPLEAEGICYALLTDRTGATAGTSDDVNACDEGIGVRFEYDFRYLPAEVRSAHAMCRVD